MEAMRCLKGRVSDVVFEALVVPLQGVLFSQLLDREEPRSAYPSEVGSGSLERYGSCTAFSRAINR
jgi:hypothetical protein